MMMPSRARKTQSSPRRANVCFQTHDEMRFIRVARLPNSSCKYFPALLLYKPMRSTLSYSTLWYYILMTVNNNRHGELAAMPSVLYKMASKCHTLCVCVSVSSNASEFLENFNSVLYLKYISLITIAYLSNIYSMNIIEHSISF